MAGTAASGLMQVWVVIKKRVLKVPAQVRRARARGTTPYFTLQRTDLGYCQTFPLVFGLFP